MKSSPFNIKLMQEAGLSPLKIDDDYSHVPIDSLIARQQFNESRFKSDAVSEDGLEKGYVPKGTKYEDLANDDKTATQFQENYMSDLLTRSWNTGTDQVKRAKALAAYNMGPTGLVNHLNAQKEKGIDIYKSLNWLEELNKETKDYVKNIMLGGDEDYEREFNQEYKKKFGKTKNITPEQISGLSPL